jgi:anti-sigma factor RsiW
VRPFQSPSWACDRARQAVSLRLDGELSQIERALLDRHIDRCPDCAAFAADTSSFTAALRDAAPVRLEVPIRLPLRRRRVRDAVRNSGAWVAAASVAATALLAVMMLPGHNNVETGAVASPSSELRPNQDLHDLRILRMAQMKPPAERLSRTRLTPDQHGQQVET